MSDQQTIKKLYSLAMAEGEGVGTAYEYYAKRLILLPWLAGGRKPEKVLVAGLPERYGSSLDFLLLGAELGCRVTAVDDRQDALTHLDLALERLRGAHYAPELQPQLAQSGDLTKLSELQEQFDLVLSSEVLQRLSSLRREKYVGRLREFAPKIAIFTPNAGNKAHVNLSGLDGLQKNELYELVRSGPEISHPTSKVRVGYLDLPPFPPGITRSSSQRQDAATGKVEAFAMWGLGYYARAEHLLPLAWRRRWAHIVYALIGRSPR